MAETPSGAKRGSYNFDQSLGEILGALEQIQRNIPNGEVKVLKEKVESLEGNYDDLRADLRDIKKVLLDPETGVVVRINKALDAAKENDEYIDKIVRERIEKIQHIEKWQDNVTKVLWLVVAGVITILVNLFLHSSN